MPQQWNQWEYPIVVSPQKGMYWADLHHTFEVNCAPVDIWAHTHVSSFRVFDRDPVFVDISFRNYEYVDEHGIQRRVDVFHPDNLWNTENFIWSYGMVCFTVQYRGRSVGARGIVIVEHWSEPHVRPTRVMTSTSSIGSLAGRLMLPLQAHQVALCVPGTDDAVYRHTAVVMEGGRTMSVEEVVKVALDNLHQSVASLSRDYLDKPRSRQHVDIRPEQLDVRVSSSPDDLRRVWWTGGETRSAS